MRLPVLAVWNAVAVGTATSAAARLLVGTDAARMTVTAVSASALFAPVLNKFLRVKKQLSEPPVPPKVAHKGGVVNCFF
mgnify:FL=1